MGTLSRRSNGLLLYREQISVRVREHNGRVVDSPGIIAKSVLHFFYYRFKIHHRHISVMAQLDSEPWSRRMPRIAERAGVALRRLTWPSVSSLESLRRQGCVSLL